MGLAVQMKASIYVEESVLTEATPNPEISPPGPDFGSSEGEEEKGPEEEGE